MAVREERGDAAYLQTRFTHWVNPQGPNSWGWKMAQSKTSKHPRLAQLRPSARLDASLEDDAGGGKRLLRGLPPSRSMVAPLLDPLDDPEPPPELALGSTPPDPEPELAEGSVEPLLDPGSTELPEEDVLPPLLLVVPLLVPPLLLGPEPEDEPKAPPSYPTGSLPTAHPRKRGRARIRAERGMGMGTLR
jgi:hypothetical protein